MPVGAAWPVVSLACILTSLERKERFTRLVSAGSWASVTWDIRAPVAWHASGRGWALDT